MSTRDTDAAARFLRDDAPPPEGALLGRIALELHLLSHDQLQGALRYLEQERAKGRNLQLGQILLTFRYLTAEDLGRVLEEQRRRQEIATTIPSGGRTQIGSYEIVEEIGRGAMGFVYKAFDPKLKRTVAIKTVREDRCDAAFLERFQREAVALARLHHPGIVTLYEAGVHRGLPFVAMEMVEGSSLEERLRRGRLPFGEAARIAEAAARAVHHAHGEGVIHRDLKPGNILLDRDEHPRIVDFGLARVETDRIAMTMSGDVLGTPAYMSPEQVKGARKLIDARTDVYALGAILYEMLTGRMPFSGRTAAELFDKILTAEPPPPRRFRAIPRDLEVICLKAMAKEQERRYGSAELFAEDLRRFQAGEPILARPPSVWYRFRRRLPRLKVPIAVGLVAALALAIFAPRLTREIRTRREKERQLSEERTIRKTKDEAITRAKSLVEEGSRAYLQARGAQREEKRQLLDTARDLFSKALAEVPGMPEAYLGIAKVHADRREKHEALAALEKAIAGAPALYEAYVERIRVRIDGAHYYITDGALDISTSSGLLDLAREIADDVEKVQTCSNLKSDILFARGTLSVLSGEYARAVEDFEELLRLTPGDASAWRTYSLALSAVGQFAKAEEALSQAISRSTTSLSEQDYLVRAAIRQRLGKLKEAIEDYGECIALAPFDPMGYKMRAWCLALTQRLPEALADISKAIALEPADADSHVLRGKILTMLGRPMEAIPDFTRAIDLNRTSADAYAGRGAAYALSGDQARGMADLDEAIRLDPNHAEAMGNRAYCRVQERDFEGAMSDFDRALELDPKLSGAYRNRGFLHLSQRRWEAAISDLTQALDLNPQDVKARYGRAQARAQGGDRSGAAEDARKALELNLPPQQRQEMEALLKALGQKP